MKLYLQVTAYRARQLGLWEALMSRMDECETPTTLTWWWASADRQALTGRMPPEWQELAEEEYWRRVA